MLVDVEGLRQRNDRREVERARCAANVLAASLACYPVAAQVLQRAQPCASWYESMIVLRAIVCRANKLDHVKRYAWHGEAP